MRHIFFSLYLFIFCHTVFSQFNPFEKYNFNEGGYSILGLKQESSPNALADSLGSSWYIDDIKLLNLLKSTWNFDKECPRYACGYHCSIILCKNGKKLTGMSVNIECEQIVTSKSYVFDPNLLRNIYGKTKKPKYINEQKELTEARKYINSIQNNQNLIYAEQPLWTIYEGKFSFSYTTDKQYLSFNDEEHGNPIIQELKQIITNTYPEESFQLYSYGGSISEEYIKISCNKTLYSKFNIDNCSITQDWQFFTPIISTYWKNTPNRLEKKLFHRTKRKPILRKQAKPSNIYYLVWLGIMIIAGYGASKL